MRYILSSIIIALFVTSCTDKEAESRKLIREGVKQLYSNNMEDALLYFEKSAQLNPRNQEAWYHIGAVYQNKADYHKAIDYYTKAIALKSDYADAYFNRGLCWFYLGDRNKSCDDWLLAESYGKDNLSDRTDKCR